jgi:hypothetical protein
MSSSALSVADFMARCCAAIWEAAAPSRQVQIRAVTYFGSNMSRTVLTPGSNS